MPQSNPTEGPKPREFLGTRVPKREFVSGKTRRIQVIGIGEDGYPDHHEEVAGIVFGPTNQSDFDEEGWPRRTFR